MRTLSPCPQRVHTAVATAGFLFGFLSILSVAWAYHLGLMREADPNNTAAAQLNTQMMFAQLGTKSDGVIDRTKHENATKVEECSLEKKWEPRADHEFSCPTAWPLPFNQVGCCSAATGSIVYASKDSTSSWCGHGQQFRKSGASLLQGKRMFSIGDSVGHHWLNAMLLDAHKNRQLSLFPSNASTWSEFYNPSTSYYEYDERGFCAFPFKTVDMSSAWASAPSIVSAVYPNDLCPPSYKTQLHKQCCPHNHPISRTGAISVKLNETKPNIVILQMGVHYHTVSSFQAALREMLMTLENYSAMNVGPLVLFLESLPQHFDSPDGDGSYDGFHSAANRSAWTCTPLNSSQIESDLRVGMHNFNQIARRAVEQTPGLKWLPSNGEAFAFQHDGHAGATKCCARHTDCTHYCYSPNLWQPAIDPFYVAVNGWFRAGS